MVSRMKRVPDLLTVSRAVIAVAIFSLGFVGKNALEIVILLTMLGWTTDIFDGRIARKYNKPVSWVGEQEFTFDMLMVFSGLCYLVMVGFIPFVYSLIYVMVAAAFIAYFRSKSVTMSFACPIVALPLVVAGFEAPRAALWYGLWIALALLLDWRRFLGVVLEQPIARRFSEVRIGTVCGDTSLGRALDESLLKQERLDDVGDRVPLLRQGGCQGVQTDRPSREFRNESPQDRTVEIIESDVVDLEHIEGLLRDRYVDLSFPLDFGDVTRSPQQAVRDAWRASRPLCQLDGPLLGNRNTQQRGRADHDRPEFVGAVETHPEGDLEAITHRG
jgi:hypothetical protein